MSGQGGENAAAETGQLPYIPPNRIFMTRNRLGITMRQVARIARKSQMWVNQLETGYFALPAAEEDALVEAIERVAKFINWELPEKPYVTERKSIGAAA
jgi:transcriptional regulator with XRE-family HTH domain